MWEEDVTGWVILTVTTKDQWKLGCLCLIWDILTNLLMNSNRICLGDDCCCYLFLV